MTVAEHVDFWRKIGKPQYMPKEGIIYECARY